MILFKTHLTRWTKHSWYTRRYSPQQRQWFVECIIPNWKPLLRAKKHRISNRNLRISNPFANWQRRPVSWACFDWTVPKDLNNMLDTYAPSCCPSQSGSCLITKFWKQTRTFFVYRTFYLQGALFLITFCIIWTIAYISTFSFRCVCNGNDVSNGNVVFNENVICSAQVHKQVVVDRAWGHRGAPWEFNLRDLSRWCALAAKDVSAEIPLDVGKYAYLVYCERLRTADDKTKVCSSIACACCTSGTVTKRTRSVKYKLKLFRNERFFS